MKFIGKLLLYVLIALAVAILGLYFLLQTRWGAEHVSAWVSQNSSYHLAFDAIDHRFSSPSHILLEKRHLWPGWSARHAGRQNGRYWTQ
ncbi:Putative exported protein [Citrobacter freundii]|uniref:Exported protein n=1 Tax=Citrobacter freundii TaxID=546 RepID=A0A7G2IUB5_CITFR|nr:Putative exported protein [Citrobacter freundii]